MLLNTFEAPFQKNEGRFSETAFFDELGEEREVTRVHPLGATVETGGYL